MHDCKRVGSEFVRENVACFSLSRRDMSKPTNKYPAALRAKILKLASKGATARELGKQFEPSEASIRNWLEEERTGVPAETAKRLRREQREAAEKKAEPAPTTDGVVSEMRLTIRLLREENAFLEKMAAWFMVRMPGGPRG